MTLRADPLDAGRDAARRGAWRDALAAYLQVDADDLTPADLEQFAEAAWWTGAPDRATELRAAAFAGYSRGGDRADAARVALTLSADHEGRGAVSVQQGWLATAERLLAGEPESPAHGFLAVYRAHSAITVFGDVPGAAPLIAQARAIAERLRDRDLEALAAALDGMVHVRRGDVDDGLALLDEAAAAAVGGDLRPYTTGLVYCCTISACDAIGDYRRAAEWTETANRWCDRLDVSGFPGACRVHRAALMRLRGEWPEAEAQALTACEEVRRFDRLVTAAGYYEVGEIRRRRGEFAPAAEMYALADEWGHEPQPGLALLRLAEGRLDAAAAGIDRALTDADPLGRVRHLPARIEIAVAAADLDGAAAAAAELDRLVDGYRVRGRPATGFEAARHLAWGRLALARGEADEAVRRLRQARAEWQAVGAPYETAQVRTLLGQAYRRAGDEDGAVSELEAALATFERLGARLDEERVKELLGRLETRRTFMFTDIVDSTRLVGTLGDAKWSRLLARHDALARDRIVAAGGDVIKHTGDGFFASFPTPRAAVDAAVAFQRALADEVVAPDVRIGLHTGAAVQTDVDDFGGQSVHLAARIGAAAAGGEILASRETLAGVGGVRNAGVRFEALRGFDGRVEVVAVDWR